MDVWTGFYTKLFNFRRIRFFDIEGRASGLFSGALTSPEAKSGFRSTRTPAIPARSRNISTYIAARACSISPRRAGYLQDLEALREDGLPFMPCAPKPIWEDRRAPAARGEDVARLKHDGILIDGEGVVDGGHIKVLLQIFSANAIGPIFFEFIQRKGDDGFGEGNFKALFRSMKKIRYEEVY